ncbi:hypothetical protein NA57DRAFT_30169 [Rhizodiscina lignyota]|uniref:Sorting nexin MVP1 n=1 Tax=Rhizodiscina lignyota TaxID=1504668 RepID=A0A9P4IVA5_9PEZI|nr:hypothetical protein NA57DRAFT_30169 [Rhizodiscina lignyota]
MSLFGEDDDFTPSRSRANKSSGLFEEETANPSSNSLFADDDTTAAAGDSPWAFPTPKKAARGNLVKNLLQGAEVPDGYVDTFDQLMESGNAVDGGISIEGVRTLMSEAGVNASAREQILSLVGLKDDQSKSLGRGEFNVLMALIGLAQEGEDVTLDGVDERRRNLPRLNLGNFTSNIAKQSNEPPNSEQPTQTAETPQKVSQPPSQSSISPSKTRTVRKTSYGLESDPWASPEMHKNHNHTPSAGLQTNGASSNGVSSMPARTTSTFTTSASDQPERDTTGGMNSNTTDTGGWGSFNPAPTEQFRDSGLGGEGFGIPPSGDDDNNGPGGMSQSMSASRVVNNGVEEVITVSAIQEKEGMFMFQHRNYEVTSTRRNSKVIRRYSDFVWLLDCLHKRYPFRQLPLLPPKRVAINGNHIAADNTFIEKRRRGLARFANALVRHPVLSQEQLVIMFLTVPTELAVWRKQATISVQEEFAGRSLPPGLEDSLPSDLQDMFDTVRSGVRRSTELYINLCNILERLGKRNEGIALEYARFSSSLQSLTEASADTYAADVNDVPLLNDGMIATAKHLSQSQALLEDEAKAWDEGVLEDLKRQRDCLVSVRDMFDRRDRYDRDNIPQLEKRIEANERKLSGIRGRPEGTVKPGEAEKVEEAIFKDKQSIVSQHARSVFVKECIRDEILFFQGSQYHVSRLHQDWSQERVKYAEMQADNWRQLSEEVEGMPLGD